MVASRETSGTGGRYAAPWRGARRLFPFRVALGNHGSGVDVSVQSMKKLVVVAACLLAAAAFAFSSPARADDEAEAAWQRGRGGASFPHGSKSHSKINCAECHAVSRSQPDVRQFPGHAKCIVCHNFAS